MKDINFLVDGRISNTVENDLDMKKSIPAAKIIMVVLCVTIGIAILFVPKIVMYSMERQIKEIEQSLKDPKYNELITVKNQYKLLLQNLNNKKAVINDIEQKSATASQIILLVEQAIPSGCYINSLSFTGNTISISGKAENSLVYAELLGNLNRLDLIQGSANGVSFEEAGTSINYSLSYTVTAKGGNE